MKLFWTILKCFGIAAGSITILYGVFTFFDGLKDEQTDILEMVEYNNVELGFMAKDITGIQDTLEDIMGSQVKQGQRMVDMESAAKFYIRNQKQMTDDAMQDAVETILKKNKNMGMFCPLLPDSLTRSQEWDQEWDDYLNMIYSLNL